ncbi:hypothetical protein, partial [Agrobacterium tumefaciens]|uniref:hypothetical protein n=1 Tax=Agrobacterium tumefaciens TaxID=358 RepID=UPI00287F3BF1
LQSAQRNAAQMPWLSNACRSFSQENSRADAACKLALDALQVAVQHELTSPGLIGTWEIADGIDSDERARFAADRGCVESR